MAKGKREWRWTSVLDLGTRTSSFFGWPSEQWFLVSVGITFTQCRPTVWNITKNKRNAYLCTMLLLVFQSLLCSASDVPKVWTSPQATGRREYKQYLTENPGSLKLFIQNHAVSGSCCFRTNLSVAEKRNVKVAVSLVEALCWCCSGLCCITTNLSLADKKNVKAAVSFIETVGSHYPEVSLCA